MSATLWGCQQSGRPCDRTPGYAAPSRVPQGRQHGPWDKVTSTGLSPTQPNPDFPLAIWTSKRSWTSKNGIHFHIPLPPRHPAMGPLAHSSAVILKVSAASSSWPTTVSLRRTPLHACPRILQGGIDDKALCEATFLLFHDKFWSRPINTEKVLKCHFRNCEKIIQHETPVPQPSYGIVSFVVVPIFLVVVGSILAMCYFSRLRYRQKYWTQTQSNRPQRIRVTCQDIGYQVTTKEGSRTILHPTSCHLQSGRTLAIMGSSGAGKTTFLDIVAGRLKTGSVTGCLLVNGVPLDSAAALQTYRQYVCAYVMQDDCLPAYLTTEECVLYSAKLRLPLGMPLEEKQARVEEVCEGPARACPRPAFRHRGWRYGAAQRPQWEAAAPSA